MTTSDATKLTYTLTKKASKVAKMLLPILKSAEKDNLDGLTHVNITEGSLWATDRYLAVKIPLTEFFNVQPEDEQKLEGHQLTLPQIVAIAAVKRNELPGAIQLTQLTHEGARDGQTYTQVAYLTETTQVVAATNIYDYPRIGQFFDTETAYELTHLSLAPRTVQTVAKMITATKADGVTYMPLTDRRVKVVLNDSDLNAEILMVNPRLT